MSWPIFVSLISQLSCLKIRRCSALLVIILYGSTISFVVKSSIKTPMYAWSLPSTIGLKLSIYLSAFIPAIIPCAAASSYPLVPFIWPAKKSPDTIFDSKLFLRSSALMQSYSIAYAYRIILTYSKPGISLYIFLWISHGILDDIPCTYTSSELAVSGSKNNWWRSLSAKRIILSSMLGQYLGPIPWILPEYSGARSIFSRIKSCISVDV